MVKHCYSLPLIINKGAFWVLKYCLFVCLLSSPALSQRPTEKDSLLQILQHLPDDTIKVNILNKLCKLCYANDSKGAIEYGKQAALLAHKLDYLSGIAAAEALQGKVLRVLGQYDEALEKQRNAIRHWTQLSDSLNLAESLRELGINYRRKGDYPKSLDYFIQALRLYESLNYPNGIASTASSMGVIYYRLKNYDVSRDYFLKALKLHEKLNAKDNMAIAFNSLGNVYSDLGDYEKSLSYYKKYKKIKHELKDQRSVAIALSNIGFVYAQQNKHYLAIDHYQKSLRLRDSLGREKSKLYPLQYLAESYVALKEYDKAYKYSLKALDIANEIGEKQQVVTITKSIARIYEEAGNYQQALNYYQQYKALDDSLFSENKAKQVADIATKYETEKKEQEILLLKTQAEKKKTLIQAITLGALLLVMLAIVLYQSNQRKQQTNQVLLLQKQEIEVKTEEILAQRDMLEQQHKDIRDSINYARKIQTAILPLPEEISAAIPEHFIFYQPRDIVSGDFYWFATVKNEETGRSKYVISASDCTGHGVPGAFMSMIGNDLLNDLVKARQITQPDIILNKLHKGVRKALHQESSENTDGMDISLCVIDPIEKTIEYAGANSALVYVKEGERTRIAPDQTSVGGDMPISQEGFMAHTISYVDAPVMCYLYTDGYRDQFGGERGKKFLRSRMQELIFYISELSMQEQRRQIEETINDWMKAGGFEQMDDMLVIGFKLS